jgi:16S rRNA (cytosine967-C5)-methyltransferase
LQNHVARFTTQLLLHINRARDVFRSLFFRPSEDRLSAHDRAGLPARQMAVRLLAAVLKDRHPFDEAFDQIGAEERFKKLEPRDRAFAYAIVLTVLRRAGQLRAMIANFIEKRLPKKRGNLDEILLSAAAQLVFLKTPPHAVINLAVFQVQKDPQARRLSGLANAVLRRISEQTETLLATQDEARLNTPDWFWQRWKDAYGEHETYRLTAQHLVEPPLDLTVKSDAEGWAARLGGIVLPTGSVRVVAKGRIEELAGYNDGEWWVQDVAASLPARLLGDVRGKVVADLCAAPGGKTAQLAHAGAKVWAVDISDKRLNRLRTNLARLKLDAEIVTADCLRWTPPEPLDAILLDAPCSSTGTIRRNPDIPHLKNLLDVGELADLQRKMLWHALDILKPGGMLVYCTCSLEPIEGPIQIANALNERTDAALAPVRAEEMANRTDWIDDMGALRTLPHYLQFSEPDLSGMDGFYIARLVKRGEGSLG